MHRPERSWHAGLDFEIQEDVEKCCFLRCLCMAAWWSSAASEQGTPPNRSTTTQPLLPLLRAPKCQAPLQDVLAFDVHVSKDGNPQASRTLPSSQVTTELELRKIPFTLQGLRTSKKHAPLVRIC